MIDLSDIDIVVCSSTTPSVLFVPEIKEAKANISERVLVSMFLLNETFCKHFRVSQNVSKQILSLFKLCL